MGTTNQAAFDAWAREGAGAKMEEAHSFAGKKVLDRIPIGYDESFIDLGCGNGWATRYVAQKIPTIGLCVGVDSSGELIKEARRLSAGRYPVKFLQVPIEEVPFGEAAFHHAFSMEALYYTTDPPATLRSIWRMLKLGGHFHLVIDFYKENPLSEDWRADFPNMQFLGQDEWVGLLKQAGFVDVQAERILDDRPIAEDLPFPWGGFKSRADLATFRTQIGSLYVVGRKAEVSHALDPYLDQARKDIGQTPAKGSPAGAQAKPGGKRKRFGLF